VQVVQDTWTETAEVSPTHPALAGHFPGNPVVPGAVVLEFVERAVSRAFASRVCAIALVRFHALLKPTQTFSIELARADRDTVTFRVIAAGTRIATGRLRLELPCNR
jgi:3-hydroxymyristoyl/3-hydroxydecanoyl-(acyl carrier protein) dehydratase